MLGLQTAGVPQLIEPPEQWIESLHNLLTFEAPPIYLCMVSHTLELSLESSLQLSLMVLVCYWSYGKN